MLGYTSDVTKMARENTDFRHVLYTGKYSQLVLMTLQPSEEIGMEVHPTVDQFFHVVDGTATVIMDGETSLLSPGMVAIVPAGTNHNVINASATDPLKLYTIYSPANHPDGTIKRTKAEAEGAEK